MPNTPINSNVRYEVITQEDSESGDLILPIPQPVLESLGWKEGDDIELDILEDGSFLFKRVNK